MKVGLIGCGVIGAKRIRNLPEGLMLKSVYDTDSNKMKDLASDFGTYYTDTYQEILDDKEIEVVFVATTNDALMPITLNCLKMGKHVLVEKPGARTRKEIRSIISFCKERRRSVIIIGYNHRYHPAILKSKEIIDSGEFGKVLFIRARYGHGGRKGYEKEWRFNPEIAGGGELLDQGSHLIDLANFFVGEMDSIGGVTTNFFWRAPLEDSSFFIMKGKKGQIAHFSATAVEWKNIFVFEIFLKRAKLQIDGLGKSYGTETLTIYKMKKEMGPPEIDVQRFEEDDSWFLQNQDFYNRIKTKNYSQKSLMDAEYVLGQIEKIYSLGKNK